MFIGRAHDRHSLLEARALQSLSSLAVIESEVFAFDFNEGMIVRKNSKRMANLLRGKVVI